MENVAYVEEQHLYTLLPPQGCCLRPGDRRLTTLQTWEISRELAAAKLHIVQEQGHFQLQQLALRRENTF